MSFCSDSEKVVPPIDLVGKSVWRQGVLAGVCLMAFLLSGCATLKEAPPLARRVVVLDFTVPEDMRQHPNQVRGWWLRSRTIVQSPNAGTEFADVLARHLTGLRYLEQHSRADLAITMSEKRKNLMDKFKDFSDADYSRMLEKISPVDYGEELGVEQVITGKIIESYTSENRIFLFWRSRLKVQVDVWDMATGKVAWSRTFSGSKWFYSRPYVMNHLAPEIIEALDRDFYQRLGRTEP
jgi:hypothetical protein